MRSSLFVVRHTYCYTRKLTEQHFSSVLPLLLLQSREQRNRLSVCSKLCYAIGGAPYQITGSALGFFLQIYLLDVAQVNDKDFTKRSITKVKFHFSALFVKWGENCIFSDWKKLQENLLITFHLFTILQGEVCPFVSSAGFKLESLFAVACVHFCQPHISLRVSILQRLVKRIKLDPYCFALLLN